MPFYLPSSPQAQRMIRRLAAFQAAMPDYATGTFKALAGLPGEWSRDSGRMGFVCIGSLHQYETKEN